MIIRSIVAALLLALSCSPSFAQDEEGEQEYPITNIAPLVGPGTKLIYEVEANGMKYDLIVTMKDKTGQAFDWEMTAPVNKKGSITRTKKGMEQASVLYNYFADGASTLDHNTTSVWLSQAMLKAMSKGKFVVRQNGAGDEPQPIGTYTGSIPWNVLLDGKTVYVDADIATRLVSTPGGSMVPATGGYSMNFLWDKSFPLILRMDFDFLIVLREIRTR